MSRLFFLLFAGLATAVFGESVDLNKSFEPFYGEYYAVYSWPKNPLSASSTVCADPVIYSEPNKLKIPFEYKCNQRTNPNIALVRQQTIWYKKVLEVPILADIITTSSEIEPALTDRCHWEPVPPVVVHKSVFRRINENFFVEYDNVPDRTTYIYGKYIPGDDELKTLADGVEEMKGQEGGRACPLKAVKSD